MLKDLIPENHIDFHSHILFGIDDGAKTFEDSLFLVKSLMNMGISEIITTPHVIKHVWENTSEGILNRQNEVVQLLAQENIHIPFRAAAEYLMDDEFVNLFKSQPLLTLKENYVLVEMSYINAPIQLYDIIFDLQVAGYKPVLAHPERYTFFHNNLNEYKKLKKAGCLFQLNLLSVMGYYGESVAKTAQTLLNSGLIDFASSDAHHSKHIQSFEGKVILKDIKPLQDCITNTLFFK
ncbi:MAG: histidinol phosphatase, partial [Flavobacterium sp.]